MNIKKVEKITHYELNVTLFELIVIKTALECLRSEANHQNATNDINDLINVIEENIQ